MLEHELSEESYEVNFKDMKEVIKMQRNFSLKDQDFTAGILFIIFEILITLANKESNLTCNRYSIGFFFGFMYWEWNQSSQEAFYEYQFRVKKLKSLLFSNDKVETEDKNKDLTKSLISTNLKNKLHCYKLSPKRVENLESWFIMRLDLMECDDCEIGIKESIYMMNSSFFVIMTFSVWMLYMYFIDD